MNLDVQKLKADLIRKRCIQMDISLRDAATEIGISAATLSRLECGKCPDINTLILICQWIGMPIEYYVKKQ